MYRYCNFGTFISLLLFLGPIQKCFCVSYYQMVSVTEDKFKLNRELSDVGSLTACTAQCTSMAGSCNGLRYNLTDRPSNSCLLGTYDITNDFQWAYNPGDYPTYWRINYSSDFCYAKFPGMTGATPLIEFCKRMGGQIPEIRSPADKDSLREVTSGTPLGLRKHDDGVWRWESDGAVGVEPALNPDAQTQGSCAKLKGITIMTHQCTSRIFFACQFC